MLSLPEDSEDRNLADLVPVIQPNIILAFSSELGGRGEYHDDKEHKYLEMEVDEKMKFKIKPKESKRMNSINYLKTDLSFNNMVSTFSEVVKKYTKNNMSICFEVPGNSAPMNVM